MSAGTLAVVPIAIGFEAVGTDRQIFQLVPFSATIAAPAIAKKIPVGVRAGLPPPIGIDSRAYPPAFILFFPAIRQPKLPGSRLKIAELGSFAGQLDDAWKSHGLSPNALPMLSIADRRFRATPAPRKS